jgi:type VII secretion protein EccB
MATRRDELSAHSYARKRTLAAFLQPESRVSDEDAPRPVRAIMPSAVMGVVLVAGCIAWGAIAPSAPEGWDAAGEHIIVDSDSTTRYVVLTEHKNGKDIKQLHPVLNYASAKLVLDKDKGDVMEVAGKNIDKSSIARGATIGIPYAPDRLPSTPDAGTPKEWAVCEKPGSSGGGAPQQGVFVLGGQDKNILKGKNRLASREALYVEDSQTGVQYVVTGDGTKLRLSASKPGERALLTQLAMRDPGEPQKVSSQWLATLNQGTSLRFPTLDATAGSQPHFSGLGALPAQARHVGAVLKSSASGAPYYYVVLDQGVRRFSPLVAKLIMGGVNQKQPYSVTPLEAANAGATKDMDTGGKGWPENTLVPVNRTAQGLNSVSRTVSCSVYTGRMSADGKPKLAAWAGHDYPANIVEGSASAYVSSGSGLLYQEVSGRGGGGRQYLLTDSGLRYALAGSSGGQEGGDDKGKSARVRLGYEKAKIARVPGGWSALLPKGPTLDSKSASQEQGM